MWLVEAPNGSVRYLCLQNVYTVGRKNTDIIISNDDSISRNHGQVLLKDNKVYVADIGSKYGTYLGDDRLEINEELEVKNDMEIKFGLLQSIYKFKEIKINVFTSNINSAEKPLLFKNIEILKGQYSTDWFKDCTHLTVSVIKLTVKVLCALTEGQPIVGVNFWNEFVNCVKNDWTAPNPKDFLPEINESLLNKNVTLDYNPERKNLFVGKTFIFLTEKTMKSMQDIINITGGSVVLWAKSKITLDMLSKEESDYLFIEENLQYIDQSTEMFKTFYKSVQYLETMKKRSIPLQEIALAVLYCSCEKDCNSKFNRAAVLVSDNTQASVQVRILAPETEENSQKSIDSMSFSQASSIQPSYINKLQPDNFLKEPNNPLETVPTKPSKETKKTLGRKQLSNIENDQSSREHLSKVVQDSLHISEDVIIVDVASKSNDIMDVISISDDEASTSTGVKRSAAEVDGNISKRIKDDKQNSNPFTFRLSKTNMNKITTEKITPQPIVTVIKSEENKDANPFTLKRKADAELQKANKKIPFENISNIVQRTNIRNADFLSSTAINEDNVDFCPDISLLISSSGWLSKDTMGIKEYIKTEDRVCVKLEVTDEVDEERLRWRESFRDKIIVEFMDLEVHRPNSITCSMNSSVKNFKKFRKIYPVHIQSHIVPRSEYQVFVCGRDSVVINSLSADEADSNDEEFGQGPNTCQQRSTNKTLSTTSTRKFNFCV